MKHLYICSCTTDGGVYHYTQQGDEWQFCHKLSLDRPMYIIAQEKKAYVVLRETDTETHHGGLLTCDIAPDGELVPCSTPQSTCGIVPCHVAAHKNNVYVVNYLSGSILRLPDTLCIRHGHGPNAARQDASHPHFVMADGSDVLCTDLGRDVIDVYDRSLAWKYSVVMRPGSGPRHLALTEDGRLLCINELDCTLTLLEKQENRWRCIQTVNLLDAPRDSDTAAAIRVQGNTVYTSIRGKNVIVTLKVEKCGVTRKQQIACGGESPRDIFIAFGKVFCANEMSGTMTELEIAAEGLSEAVVIENVPSALSICAIDLESEGT